MSESAFGVDHGEISKALKLPSNPMAAFKAKQKPKLGVERKFEKPIGGPLIKEKP